MDVYERLAGKLDELPNGFPRTETGLELKILRKIFLTEEAEVAVEMGALPETAAKIAERLSKPVGNADEFLDGMVRKGQIMSGIVDGVRVYSLMPFLIGVFEGQRNRIDAELAEMFEAYAEPLLMVVAGFSPALGRVVPVAMNISADTVIHSSDNVRKMLEEAKTFILKTCMCRRQKELVGSPCKHGPKGAYCLTISKVENDFTGPVAETLGKAISKEEALKVIADAEEKGLIHCTSNTTHFNQFAICNCCECCCGLFGAVKKHNVPYMYAESAYLAKIDQDKCTQCGVCKDERCPIDAIAENEGTYTVISERCLGCGVCTVTCPTEAISLEPHASTERLANNHAWNTERAKSRGLPFPPASDRR
jgi:Pyruvate/2-oxoacid:ferredoxin oxidoreductase delta subunit